MEIQMVSNDNDLIKALYNEDLATIKKYTPTDEVKQILRNLR